MALRRRRPTWGPEKLQWTLRRKYPGQAIPSVRTLGRWLAKEGMVRRRIKHGLPGPKLPPPPLPLLAQPNDLWTMDFKGRFFTADGTRLMPLTVRDEVTRYVLLVRHVLPNYRDVSRALKRLFRRVGLPKAIRVDNGPPFAGRGALGLSTLSVWWTRLGIRVIFGRPACPQDNPAHEQMHRVLKADALFTPAANPRAQQRRFDRWRKRYNNERPHRALGLKTPASFYRPSSRPFHTPAPLHYPPGWQRLQIGPGGIAWWGKRQRMFGRAFAEQYLGITPIKRGSAKVYLGTLLIGSIHLKDQAGMRPARIRDR